MINLSLSRRRKEVPNRGKNKKEETLRDINIKRKIVERIIRKDRKMKVPVESSIYWDSVGSQRSTSVGSTGDAYSSGSASRHYVDPWDLENYAYLRRHSVAGLTQQASRRHRRPTYRLTQEARVHSEYWYSTSVREPGYDAPAFVEELYCGPARPANNSCYYHQPIYEDEVPDYVAPFPVYAPLSEVRHGEFMEDHRRHRYKSSSMRDLHRSLSAEPNLTPVDSIEIDMPDYRSRQDYRSMEQENYMVQIVPPPHLDLNTYGHLKIDYTNSWNSLNRKIGKEI